MVLAGYGKVNWQDKERFRSSKQYQCEGNSHLGKKKQLARLNYRVYKYHNCFNAFRKGKESWDGQEEEIQLWYSPDNLNIPKARSRGKKSCQKCLSWDWNEWVSIFPMQLVAGHGEHSHQHTIGWGSTWNQGNPWRLTSEHLLTVFLVPQKQDSLCREVSEVEHLLIHHSRL